MKPVRLIILLLIIAVIIGAVAWRSQWLFLHNKVTFLLNQRRFDDATQLLNRLEARDPDNPRTDFLQVKALAITEEFEQAVAVANNASDAEHSEMLYWLALAYHQMGDVAAAAETARKFLDRKERLPAGSQKIISALAGKTPLISPPDQSALEFRLLFAVEKSVYLGLAGLYQWEVGRLDTAAQLIRDAFELENRNPRFLAEGAKALALVGDVQGAQMFWDYSATGSIKPLYEELQSMYQGLQPVSLTLNSDDLARGGRKIDVARAVAWAAAVLAGESDAITHDELLRVTDELLVEYPYDPVLQVRKALLLENLQRTDEAIQIYQDVQQKNPNFMVLVRLMALEGIDDDSFAKRAEDFIISLQPVADLKPRDMQIDGGTITGNFLHFDNTGVCTGTITMDERGSYRLTLVAKGTRVEEKWPLLKVFVDDEVAGVNYICRSDWDCYTIPVVLEAGSHTVEMVFDEAEKPVASANENRSLYLQSLYVTLSGVAYVR